MRSRRIVLLTALLLTVLAAPAHAGRCGDVTCTADLVVSGHAEPQPIRVGEHSEYKFTAQNDGPDSAVSVKMNIDVPAGLKILATYVYGGNGCSVSGTFVSCDLGDFQKLQQAVVRIDVEGDNVGTFLAKAEVFGYDIQEPSGGNNQVTATLGVIPADGNSGSSSGSGTYNNGQLTLRATDPQRILKAGGVTIRAVVPKTGTLRLRGSVRTSSGAVPLVGVARGVRAGETVSVFMGTTGANLRRIRAGFRTQRRQLVNVLVTLGLTKAKIQLHVAQ